MTIHNKMYWCTFSSWVSRASGSRPRKAIYLIFISNYCITTTDIEYSTVLPENDFWLYFVKAFTSWKKSFNSQKTGPNLIPSKIVPIEWVDLNPKIKFAICHWSWELGSMWHFFRKSGDKILTVPCRIAVFSTRFELLLGRSEQ